MAVENISAAASSGGLVSDFGQNSEQDRISDLVRLEQDVQKLKSDYKDKAKNSGMSQIDINSKIRKYEKLISKIEQEIRQIKKQVSSKPVELKKSGKKTGGTSGRSDSTDLSMAALKMSYRMLFPECSPESCATEDSGEELQTQAANNLDHLV